MPQIFYAMNTTVKLINLKFKHKKIPVNCASRVGIK